MPKALNLVFPLKQDDTSKNKLSVFKSNFESFQPTIQSALSSSKLVHFAHAFIIMDKYLVIVAEHDAGRGYLPFFVRTFMPVLSELLSIIDAKFPSSDINSTDFYNFLSSFIVKSLGASLAGVTSGYLFSAYGEKSVNEIISILDH